MIKGGQGRPLGGGQLSPPLSWRPNGKWSIEDLDYSKRIHFQLSETLLNK